jgi:hypothetical protein
MIPGLRIFLGQNGLQFGLIFRKNEVLANFQIQEIFRYSNIPISKNFYGCWKIPDEGFFLELELS